MSPVGPFVPHTGLLATRPVSILSPDRACVANQDPDVGNRDTSRVNENEIRGAEIQSLDNDRAVALGMNINDIRILDQHGFEGPLKHSRIVRSAALVVETAVMRRANPSRQARSILVIANPPMHSRLEPVNAGSEIPAASAISTSMASSFETHRFAMLLRMRSSRRTWSLSSLRERNCARRRARIRATRWRCSSG